MLRKGSYSVRQMLNISASLHSQSEGPPRDTQNFMSKALLVSGDTEQVVYFIDPVDFGRGSVIEITEDCKQPLLRNRVFRVVERAEPTHDKAFIERLKSAKK